MPKERFPVPSAGKHEDNKGEPDMNRREFLKKAAVIGGAALAGGAMINTESGAQKIEQKEGVRHTRAKILKKEVLPALVPRKLSAGIPVRERYVITVLIEDGITRRFPANTETDPREEDVTVSKEQFDSYNAGEEIGVVYEVGGAWGRRNVRIDESGK